MARSEPCDDGDARDERGLRVSQVIDHAIIDVRGRRAGRVDDLLLELTSPAGDGSRLALKAIVSGPMARPMRRPVRAVARRCYRLLGVFDPRPAVISWRHVVGINALVHLDVDGDDAGLRTVDNAVRRYVTRDRQSSKAFTQ